MSEFMKNSKFIENDDLKNKIVSCIVGLNNADEYEISEHSYDPIGELICFIKRQNFVNKQIKQVVINEGVICGYYNNREFANGVQIPQDKVIVFDDEMLIEKSGRIDWSDSLLNDYFVIYASPNYVYYKDYTGDRGSRLIALDENPLSTDDMLKLIKKQLDEINKKIDKIANVTYDRKYYCFNNEGCEEEEEE